MATTGGERSQHFPAIEKKHGKPAAHWIDQVKRLGAATYNEQMALLQGAHGFSRAHANAVVMQVRGSTTSKRFDSPSHYFSTLEPAARAAVEAVFDTIMKKHRDLELVMAWNQPMLRFGKDYVFGVSVSKKHFTVNPFSTGVLEAHKDALAGHVVNKHTFQVPFEQTVKASLLHSLIRARLAELA